jgi:GAF domain-containing protein/HAMP domain-containing protein
MINRLLRRLTIRGRVISLFVLLLIIFAGLFILMINHQAALTDKLQQVTNINTRIERSLLLASGRVLSARINLMRYTTDTVPNASEALGDIDQAKDLINQALSLLTVPEQTTAIEAALAEIEEYQTLIGRVQTVRSAGMGDVNALLSDAYQKELDIEQRIESIVAENAQRMDGENDAEIAKAQRQMIYLTLGSAIVLILATVSVILVERSINRPISELRDGAEALRSGHLDTLIPIIGQDELSWLARTFNQMTAQIAQSYTDLENRVADRTRAAESRALQLQVAAEVARDAASASELDSLLFRAVNLIRDRFDFYHVGIFLIDDLGKFAVLRAATGEAGQSLLQREYKLRVGEVGIIGYTTGTGAARIVNDVDADFVFRRDAKLPETHSEMALPLKVGKVVMGALDVQSSKLNAFGEDDLAALQILADQLAVAIKNMRLVGELEDRLAEINTLYRRYTQDSLARVTHGSQQLGFQYDLLSLQTGQQKLPADVLAKLHSGQKVVVKEEVQGVVKSRLFAPLMLYDQMIGVLGFDQDDPNHQWSEDEIVIIEAVSNQVILALDNARLLDETQLRTDQLRLLQDVTATAAAHTSLKELLNDISQKLRAGLDVERCMIALVDAGGIAATKAALALAHPLPPESMTLGIKVALTQNSLFQEALSQKKSVVQYEEHGLQFSPSGTRIPSQPPIYSAVAIPLVARDVVIGLIVLEITDPLRRFSDEDLQLFDQLSMQISTAVEVARSIEQSTTRAERERILGNITARMRATLDVETVLRTAVEEIFHTGDFAEVSVYLAAEEGIEH